MEFLPHKPLDQVEWKTACLPLHAFLHKIVGLKPLDQVAVGTACPHCYPIFHKVPPPPWSAAVLDSSRWTK